jgi:Arc/MetJ family transcription regulator
VKKSRGEMQYLLQRYDIMTSRTHGEGMTQERKPTEAVTLRLDTEIKRAFVEIAAEETVKNGGTASVSAQDVMRTWLSQHPAVMARLGKSRN